MQKAYSYREYLREDDMRDAIRDVCRMKRCHRAMESSESQIRCRRFMCIAI